MLIKFLNVFFFNVSELMFIFRVLNFYIIFSLFFILLNSVVVKVIVGSDVKIVIGFFLHFHLYFIVFEYKKFHLFLHYLNYLFFLFL